LDNRENPSNSRQKLQKGGVEHTFVVYSKLKTNKMKKITTKLDHYVRLVILVTTVSAYVGVLVAAAIF